MVMLEFDLIFKKTPKVDIWDIRGAFFVWRAHILSWQRIMCSQVPNLKIFRTVTKNAVNKSVWWRKKYCSWVPLNKHAMNIFIQSKNRSTVLWESERTKVGEHVLHVPCSMFSTCSELTPRAPIPDGRMERIMQPCRIWGRGGSISKVFCLILLYKWAFETWWTWRVYLSTLGVNVMDDVTLLKVSFRGRKRVVLCPVPLKK